MHRTSTWVVIALASCGFVAARPGVFLSAQDTKDNRVGQAKPEWIATQKHRFEGVDLVAHVTFSPDGQLLATGARNGTIVIWEMASGKEKRRFQCGNSTSGLAFSPGGDHLLAAISNGVGSFTKTIKAWEIATGREVFSIPNGGGSIAYLPDGKQFVSVFNLTIQFRDAKTGALLREFPHRAFKLSGISPDGKMMLATRDDKTITILRVESGQVVATLKGHDQTAAAIRFSPSGKTIVTIDNDKTLRIWSAQSGEIVGRIVFPNPVRRIAFSTDGKWLAVGVSSLGRGGPEISIRGAATGKEVAAMKTDRGFLSGLVMNADGTLVASATSNRIVQVFEITKRKANTEAKR